MTAYPRLDIKSLAGTINSLPIKSGHQFKDPVAFTQDEYVVKMKPGIVVEMSSEGYIKPAGETDSSAVVGFLVNDVAGYANQNVDAIATGMSAVLTGAGNICVTDNVEDSNIAVGDHLYVKSDGSGKLTKTKSTYQQAVAVALSGNSSSNKTIIFQTLI